MNSATIFCYPTSDNPGVVPEKLLTIDEAAQVLDVHAWQVRRAVQRGSIPSYTPFNSRKLVKLSEIVAYVESTKSGGCHD